MSEVYVALRRELRRQIRSEISTKASLSGDELRSFIAERVHLQLLGKHIDLPSRRQLLSDLYNSLRGLDILQPLLDDRGITEIMVNGPSSIYIERGGIMEKTQLTFDDSEHLSDVINYFFSLGNKNINLSHPIADLRLEDGSRANAVLPPLAPDGPVLTIRKFSGIRPDSQALLLGGFMPSSALDILKNAVMKRECIFICGGTGTGKTTLLNILSQSIPSSERIITIEDSAELQLQDLPNLVRLECRPPGPDGSGGVGISDLIRSALRMRPDRIIVGEVRGAEAFDLLTAMNSGHPGTLCTGHANSCADMIRRLCNMILAATRLPYEAIQENLVASLKYLVHIRRECDGRRRVDEICCVVPETRANYRLEYLFRADSTAVVTSGDSSASL